jgi:hypothetical protein
MALVENTEPQAAVLDPMTIFEIEEKIDTETEITDSIPEEMHMNFDTMVRYMKFIVENNLFIC